VVVDYHVHTPFCGHAHGKMVEYVEAAIFSGLTEIGFSDHLGRYYLGKMQRKRYWDWGMSERDLARYFNEVMDLKALFAGRIVVRFGLEVDYIEGAEHLIEAIVANYPFDYLIGSIHCIPALGWLHLSQYAKSDPEKIYQWYFSAAQAAIQSGLFQSLAHVDFVWRYIIWPEARRLELAEYINNVVSESKKSSTDIEINANGYIWSRANYAKDFDPFNLFLDLVSKHKARITLGSDAHAPQMVAKSFPEIVKLLKSKGINHVSLFERKNRKVAALG
jgi:histidinol-phosphatase (PHP family)